MPCFPSHAVRPRYIPSHARVLLHARAFLLRTASCFPSHAVRPRYIPSHARVLLHEEAFPSHAR